MRSPRKSELLRLQALYRTDARIAQALAVPEYLVAYWRRKKKLPRYNAPKFSREQITELWSRYGDDFRCGRDLGISKAAFYSWRRKYDISERPRELKLEQLELRLADTKKTPPDAPATAPGRTATRKILDRRRSERPAAGLTPDWCLEKTARLGQAAWILSPGPTLRSPSLPFSPQPLPEEEITEPVWVSDDCGLLEWQLVENRSLLPGQLIAGPAAAAAGLGGSGCLYLDASAIKALPRVIRIELTRKLDTAVGVEDIVCALLQRGVDHDWQGAVVEIVGGPIERLSIDRKVKLCALIAYYGAAAALCPIDDVISRFYGRRLRGRFPRYYPDRTAVYDAEHYLEGHSLHPLLLDPSDTDALGVSATVDHPGGVIVGPSALPYEIEMTARIMSGRRIDQTRPVLVCPASTTVHRLAQRRGWIDTILAAGGSVVDIALARQMGTWRLVEVAVGQTGTVYCTRPFPCPDRGASPRIILAGARTAVSQLEFL